MKSKVLTFVENATPEQKAQIVDAVKSFTDINPDFEYFSFSFKDNQSFRHNVELVEKLISDLQSMGNEQPIIMVIQQAKKLLEATKECREFVLSACEGSEEQQRHAEYTSDAARKSAQEWHQYANILYAAKYAAFAKQRVKSAFEGNSPNHEFECVYRALMLVDYNYTKEILGIDKWLPE